MNKLTKALHLAMVPEYRKSMWMGVAATIEHEPAFRGHHFDTIVDVGAHKGQAAVFFRKTYPEATIYSFEPQVRPMIRLGRVAETFGIRTFPYAIGPKAGPAMMNISARDDSSSLLPIGEGQTTLHPKTKKVDEEEIQIRPLHKAIDADHIAGRALLKIDVQGSELEVLKGCEGEDLLQCFGAIYVECSWRELYTGQPTAAAVKAWLLERGFLLFGTHNPQYDDGKLVQADLMFGRERRRG